MGSRGTKRTVNVSNDLRQRPYPPRGLDPVAKSAWNQLCDDLESQGTLVKTDRNILEIYAKTYSLWQRCFDQLVEQGLTTGGRAEAEPDDGDESDPAEAQAVADAARLYLNPVAGLFNALSQKLHRILLDCGLSPATRKVGDAPPSAAWAGVPGVGGGSGQL